MVKIVKFCTIIFYVIVALSWGGIGRAETAKIEAKEGEETFREEPKFEKNSRLYICNRESEYTNLREGNSAKDYPVKATLPNGLAVRPDFSERNKAGYVYYRITVRGESVSHFVHGYVHQDMLDFSCDLPSKYSPKIVELAQKLDADNPGVRAQDIMNLNANFQGQRLSLSGFSMLEN